MNVFQLKFKSIALLGCLFSLFSCIENDIPYPYQEGNITDFAVEGQIDNSLSIDKTKGTVVVEVSDAVDITSLQIQKLQVTNNAHIAIDSSRCVDYENFPTVGFSSLDSLPKSADTRVDFTSPVSVLLQTYQDYPWTITVNQTINRTVVVSNQIGDPVIDVANKQVVVYVAKNQPLDQIEVTEMKLGGSAGLVVPDPTTITDFSRPQTFEVTRFGVTETWKVTILHSDEESVATGNSFPMVHQIRVSGTVQVGKTPVIEYKEKSASDWQTLSESSITVAGTTYTAFITGLKANTTYVYRTTVDGVAGSEEECTTASEVALTNGSFDDWYKDGNVWNPWSETGVSFWDTGNKGAATLGESNSVPTSDTSNGSGQAVKLESRFVGLLGIGKFAAGNIFTGSYVRTDGTNGVLSFGREFNTYPTGLKFQYKYNSETINKSGDSDYEYLLNRPDSMHIYVALTDMSEPYEIRTKKSDRQLFNKNDKSIIAYGEFISAETVTSYKEYTIQLDYRSYRKPKYIIIVASASKYGDFFTGGEGSTLYLDEMELLYE